MNFTVYLKKELSEQINKLSKILNKSRNSIINEAVEQWVRRHEHREWPENFFDFKAVTDVPDFKKLRKEVKDSDEDPLK